MTCTKESGTCSTCISACIRKPGWFKPGEIEGTAKLLETSVEELFRTKLAIDWWEGDGDLPTTFVVAPATTHMEPGTEYPYRPEGKCIFLTEDNRCSIHAAKPYECHEYVCNDTLESRLSIHEETARSWVNPEAQAQCVELLGREPIAEGGDVFDILGLF